MRRGSRGLHPTITWRTADVGLVLVRQGYNVLHWTQPDMTYWAVSDLNETELHEFVRLLQNQAPP